MTKRAWLPVVLGMAFFASCTSRSTAPAVRVTATVTMKDGTRLTGEVVESSAQEIKLQGTEGSAHTVPMEQVRSIEYGDPAPAATAAAVTEPAAKAAKPAPRPVAKAPAPHPEHYHPPEAVISSKTHELAAGTELSVRMEETIDSNTAVEGQTYAAEITKDVLDADGQVVIPDGTNAQIVIKSASKGGRFKGASDLVLDLQSLSVGGRRYMIDASDIQKKGRDGVGANKRTAIFTGTGAAIGAIIGAIADGGKGAAIGAASGAGAGVAAQVITKGGAIKVPVETVLTFQLDSALHVTAR